MKIALLISGNGTTMESIIKACQSGTLSNITPALVISSRDTASGIAKARALGIPDSDVVVIDPKSFSSPELFGETIIAECRKRNIDFIGQYGWMVKTPANVCESYKGMIINQHPGPLDPEGNGDFGGKGMCGIRVHEARLQFVRKVNRDFWTEVTAHRVTPNFDEGAIIKRKVIAILPDDTAETLQARILSIEHEVQIEALQDFANDMVTEFHREIPLILPGEEQILAECKAEAIKKYPNR